MSESPIVCSLGPEAARSQFSEWGDLLATSVTRMERPSDSELLLRLRPDAAPPEAIVALAQREKTCCPFFDFALVIEPDHVALRISVPSDGAAVLDEMAALIP